jgi:hypothetical protein
MRTVTAAGDESQPSSSLPGPPQGAAPRWGTSPGLLRSRPDAASRQRLVAEAPPEC